MALLLEMRWQPSLLQRRKSRPPLGLRNLGNSCYLNSVLQCLTYTPPLANLCLSSHHSNLCQKLDANGQKECPFCILEKRIARSLNLEAQHDAPSKIGSCVRLFAGHFQWGRQEDAHEFLRHVIDACHNTCLRLLKVASSATSNGSIKGGNDNGNTSTIVKDIFGGSLISQLKCLSCGNESKKIDEIMDISLDLFQSNTLKDALRRFFQAEILDGENKYSCGMCKKLSAAQKQMLILHAPNVLVIQLKRFEGINGGKINKDIAFEEVLLLSGFMSKANQDPHPEYNLFGSIVHSGYSPESGHYYAYIKDPTGQWYCCNDAYVSLSTSQEVLSEKVYILFYLRSSQRPKPVKSYSYVEAKCSNSNGNGASQIQKYAVISKSPKIRPNGELHSERNVPTALKTSKVSSGLQIKLGNVKNSEKRRVTSANGDALISNNATVNTSSNIPEQDQKERLASGSAHISQRKVEMHESSDNQNVLAVGGAHDRYHNAPNETHKCNSDASSHKRKSCDDSGLPHPNTVNGASCSTHDEQPSVGEIDILKKLLAEQASSELRTCGWTDKVQSFMCTKKKLCMKEGVPYDPSELRKLLIADAKRIFIPELPEAMKQNLIGQLRSFSQWEKALDT